VTPARGFVLDIDGTLALADRASDSYIPLPGAREVLQRLRATRTPFVAFTNGTFHVAREYEKRLAGVGLDVGAGAVLTPADVAAATFRKRGLTRIMAMGVEGVTRPLVEAGLDVVKPVKGVAGVQAVLIGWHPDFTFPDLDAACRAVWAGAALFTVSDAPYFAGRDGRMLGISGSIGAMIRSVTGKRPIVMGKPSVLGLRIACARMGLKPADVAVVGDDPTLEVTMARKGGARAVGVATGIADRAAFEALPEARAAHIILDSIGDLIRSGLMPDA
jgi:4-nitrophenyl phosphatase